MRNLVACVNLLLGMLGAVTMSAAELKIDHATVAGLHLRQMQAALAAAGLPSENGGPHSNHATEMALTSFPDGSYLELIAVQQNADPQAVSGHTWNKFLTGDAGPCAWAVQAPDVRVEAQRLAGAGIQVSSPARSGRTRPDGVRLDWETARVGSGPNGTFFPFLIRDLTSRDLRAYPGGKPTTTEFRGIDRVVVGVRDLGDSVALYRRAYDLPAPRTQRDADFGAELAWFEGTPVILAAALSPNSWLAKRVSQLGNAPCAFVLAGSSRAEPRPAHSTWFGKPVSWFDADKLGWRLGVE